MIKKGFSIILSLALLLLICSCNSLPDPAADASGDVQEDEMFFIQKEATVTFAITNEAISNPFMGFAADAQSKAAVQKCDLVYVDVTFRELEPKEGDYRFGEIEQQNNLDAYKKEGKHVVFRFLCDKPSDEAHMDIPDWLYEKTKDGKAYDISYGKGYSPNYGNETFIAHHEKAIRALGSYFGKDGFISYVELGSLGHWGEWHVKYEEGLPPIPKADVREKYIQPYFDAFPNAKILMRRPFAAAKEHGLGLFNDMAGHPESTDEWLGWIEHGGDYMQAQEQDALSAMPQAWKTAPIGGEFNSAVSMDWMLKTNLTQTADLIARSHTTFLGPKCPFGSQGNLQYEQDALYRDGVDTVLRSMGYRLSVTAAEISKQNRKKEAQVTLTWVNEGVAPLYFNLPVYLYLTDTTGTVTDRAQVDVDLSALLPGQTVKSKTKIQLPQDAGGVTICVGIVDPMTQKPAVKLNSDAQFQDLMMKLYTYPLENS